MCCGLWSEEKALKMQSAEGMGPTVPVVCPFYGWPGVVAVCLAEVSLI